MVSGGNIRVRYAVGTTLLIAAGDVTLDADLGAAVVIAGGTIHVRGKNEAALLVSPKVKPALIRKFKPPPHRRGEISDSTLVFDGKAAPAPELFTFGDLWADYGLEATLTGNRVRILRTRTEAPLGRVFQEGDVIRARGATKIESVGQFRRLLRHALDGGDVPFEIERSGTTMRVAPASPTIGNVD